MLQQHLDFWQLLRSPMSDFIRDSIFEKRAQSPFDWYHQVGWRSTGWCLRVDWISDWKLSNFILLLALWWSRERSDPILVSIFLYSLTSQTSISRLKKVWSRTLAERGTQSQIPRFFAQKNFFLENRPAIIQFARYLKNFWIFGLLIKNFIYDDLPGPIRCKQFFKKSL